MLTVDRGRDDGNSCWSGDAPRVGTSFPEDDRVELDRDEGGGEDDPEMSGGEENDLDEEGSLDSEAGRILGESALSDELGVPSASGVDTPPPRPVCLGRSSVSNVRRRAGNTPFGSIGWP